MTAWNPDLSRILTPSEIELVLADLHRRRRSINSRQNRTIFRLSVGCGLRASEIADLQLRDVKTEQATPVVLVRRGKGDKPRTVPVIDPGTLADLRAWRAEREEHGAKPSHPFVCTVSSNAWGNRLHRTSIRARFANACKALGSERLERLTVHDGRHTFLSYAVEAKGLAWARDAAGHSSASTTSIYSHARKRHEPVDLFEQEARAASIKKAETVADLRAQLQEIQAQLAALKD